MWKLILCSIAVVLFASQGALGAAGTLDSSFGGTGIVTTGFGVDVRPSAVAIDGNGNIVVSVTVGDSATSIALVRYLRSGRLDSTFGSGGIVSETFQDQTNEAEGIIIQPDGKIVLEAFTGNTTGTIAQSLLVRFNSNGALDTSFGSNGQLVLSYPAPAPYSASPAATVLEPSGELMVLFSLTPPRHNPSPVLTALARYTAGGALDSNFGTGGRSAAVSLGALPVCMGLLSNGNVLVVTSASKTTEFSSAGIELSAVSAGTIVANSSSVGPLPSPIFLSNSDFLVLSSAQGPIGRHDIDSTVVRFLPAGSVDPDFVSTLFDFAPSNSALTSVAEAIAVAPNGQIAVGGEATGLANSSVGFGVARLNSNGTLDTTFGNAGIATTSLPKGGQALGVAVQADGKVLAVGQKFSGDTAIPLDLVVIRYLGQ